MWPVKCCAVWQRYWKTSHHGYIERCSAVVINNDDNLSLARYIAECLARRIVEENKHAPAEKNKNDKKMIGGFIKMALNYNRLAQVPTDRPCTFLV